MGIYLILPRHRPDGSAACIKAVTSKPDRRIDGIHDVADNTSTGPELLREVVGHSCPTMELIEPRTQPGGVVTGDRGRANQVVDRAACSTNATTTTTTARAECAAQQHNAQQEHPGGSRADLAGDLHVAPLSGSRPRAEPGPSLSKHDRLRGRLRVDFADSVPIGSVDLTPSCGSGSGSGSGPGAAAKASRESCASRGARCVPPAKARQQARTAPHNDLLKRLDVPTGLVRQARGRNPMLARHRSPVDLDAVRREALATKPVLWGGQWR